MPNPLNLSIIIPTCGRSDCLNLLLKTLTPETQGVSPSDYEIIISHDGEPTKYFVPESLLNRINDVQGLRVGPAGNRNRGAASARGDLLVFLDDDCIATKSLLSSYLKYKTAHPHLRVFEGSVSPASKRLSLAEGAPINENGGCLWSCNFAIDRKLFHQIGGFDERFKYAAMEDVEFRARLNKLGIKTIFVREASVLHPWKLRGSSSYFEQHFESTLLFNKLYPTSAITSQHLVKALISGILFDTLPGIFKFQGRGFGVAIKVHTHTAIAAWRLLHRGDAKDE